jgi:hypothetical protein
MPPARASHLALNQKIIEIGVLVAKCAQQNVWGCELKADRRVVQDVPPHLLGAGVWNQILKKLKQRPHAPEFVFERRAGEAYSSNVYFSSAPLQTKDHLKLLDSLELLLS